MPPHMPAYGIDPYAPDPGNPAMQPQMDSEFDEPVGDGVDGVDSVQEALSKFMTLPPDRRAMLIAAITPEVAETMIQILPEEYAPLIEMAANSSPEMVAGFQPQPPEMGAPPGMGAPPPPSPGMTPPGPTPQPPGMNGPSAMPIRPRSPLARMG